MKKFSFLGGINSLVTPLAMVLIFTSCGSTTKPVPTPPPAPIDPTAKATLTVDGGPTGTMWNGINTVSYTVSATKANGIMVSIDGSNPVLVGSTTYTLSNLTKNTVVTFTTAVGTGVTPATPEIRNIDVLSQETTNLCKDVSYWTNDSVLALIGGIWQSANPYTFNRKFRTDGYVETSTGGLDKYTASSGLLSIVGSPTVKIVKLDGKTMETMSLTNNERRFYSSK